MSKPIHLCYTAHTHHWTARQPLLPLLLLHQSSKKTLPASPALTCMLMSPPSSQYYSY